MRFALLPVAMLLAACQPAYLSDGQPNPASVYFEIPVDSKFVLRKDVTFPPYRKDMFFQNGKLSDYSGVNRWIAYCALSLHAQRKVPFTVKADTFVAKKVSRQYLFQLARASFQVAEQFDRDGFQEWRVLATVAELSSDSQPEVARMTCAQWGLPQDLSNVTLNGIRKSFGDFVQLEIADLHAPSTSPGKQSRLSGGASYQ
jgi:hypothetical protein